MLLRVNYRLSISISTDINKTSRPPETCFFFISRMPLKKNTLKLGTRARPNARVRETIHTRRTAVYTNAAPTRN